LLLVAVVFTWLLLASFGSGSEQDKTQLDVVRTVINIAVSTGGAAALLLAVRKQRATEYDLWLKEQIAADDLEQKKQVAQAAEHDATERRITELYTKAVEQLGSDKAAVRLGGLYALERLAQDNEGHRQTIVNVLCAYLRMPHPTGESLQNRQVPAGAAAPATSGEEGEATRAVQDQQADHERIRQQAEERLVRQTVHRILTDHLRPERDKKTDQPTNPTFWENIELDLSGAVLEDWDFSDCEVRSVHFTRTHFHGRTGFERAVFRGNAWFGKAVFRSVAGFGGRSSTTAPGSRGQSSAAPPCSRGRSSTTAPGLTRRPSTLVPGSTRCGFGWTLRLGACGRTGGGCGSPPVMRRAV